MDEKEEDVSEESFHKHVDFYKKLNKKIFDYENEIKQSKDNDIIKHLKERIDALKLDKKRIQNMFKKTDETFWNELT